MTLVVALTVTMVGTGQTGAFAATAADDSTAFHLAAPVGIGAVALGVVGILLGILRQQRRGAEPAEGADPNARVGTPAATAQHTRPASVITVDPAAQLPAAAPVAEQSGVAWPAPEAESDVAWPAAEWPEPAPPARPQPSPVRRPVSQPEPTHQPAAQADRDWFAPAVPAADSEATRQRRLPVQQPRPPRLGRDESGVRHRTQQHPLHAQRQVQQRQAPQSAPR